MDNPDARLIVMLRNPVDIVHSLHSQFVYGFREDEKDFEKAWQLQAVLNESLVHQLVIAYQANSRLGTRTAIELTEKSRRPRSTSSGS